MPDLASLVAAFGAELHAAGVPVGPERSELFAKAILLAHPASTEDLYWCGLVTLVADPTHIEAYDRVFASVFGSLADVGLTSVTVAQSTDTTPESAAGGGWLAARTERLGTRDFGELTPDELALLADAMRRLTLATPLRRSRRYARAPRGYTVDFRATLRAARRTAGFPWRLARRRPKRRRRPLVVLCDISGSMEPYARAMLQLLYCAAGGSRAEVFTFATRLTRLTSVLREARPDAALEEAGQTAPDWSGGTRIGAALKEFNDRYGVRRLARGAVVLVISDGWDTGDPGDLAREMARLARVAYRIVWANPRTASPRYRPLVGGMAAAWPYCDAVVSAHRLSALDELLAALAFPDAPPSPDPAKVR